MGETQKNWVIHQNGQSYCLKYHLKLKTKEDVRNRGVGYKRGEGTLA